MDIQEKDTKIKADEWADMSFDQLMEQKSIMIERYLLARKLSPSMIPQIEHGLDQLEMHISQKF